MDFSKYETTALPFPSANLPNFREKFAKWERGGLALFDEKLKEFEEDALREFGLEGHSRAAQIWEIVWNQFEDGRMVSNIERAYEVLFNLVDIFTGSRKIVEGVEERIGKKCKDCAVKHYCHEYQSLDESACESFTSGV